MNCLSSFVPKTGFEPAHPCERCDLNTVRLPISPLGQRGANVIEFSNFQIRKLANRLHTHIEIP